MGIILWGFLLVALFCGLKTACVLFGGAIVIGFIWGTYRTFKNKD